MKIKNQIKVSPLIGLVLLSTFAVNSIAAQAATPMPATPGSTPTAGKTATAQVTKTPTRLTATAVSTTSPTGKETTLPANPSPTVTATPLAAVPANSSRFNLSELTGIGDIVLQGTSPSYSFFFPIPQEWKLTDVTFHLEVTHSDILRPDSSLTLLANGIPVESLRLDSANQSPETWTVRLPAEMLTAESLNITFAATLRISDRICDDILNSANWVRISNQSPVVFQYDSHSPSLQFNQFPYPFIRNRSLTADQIAVVFSPQATGEEMTSVLSISSYLGTQSTWRGLNLLAVPGNQLTDPVLQKSDLVLVGTMSQITGWLKSVDWPLQNSASDGLLLPDKSAVPEDAGVLMMAVSPANPDRAVLAVTGRTASAVNMAAEALRHSQFANMSRGEYAVIPAAPRDLTAEKNGFDWSNISLAALKYSDQPVYGIGKQRISIPLELPGSLNPQEMKVHLVFSHAPFVTTDRSYLVLSANGIPQSGLYLKAENEHQYQWDVTIPGSKLVPGKNVLEVLFDLHLTDTEACDDNFTDKAWGVLHKESSIQITFSPAPPKPDLFTYPQPFGKNTLVVISPQSGEKERFGTFQLISQLGKSLGNQARFIEMKTAAQVTEETLKGHDLILIGKPDANPWVKAALKTAPIQFDNNTRTLKTSLFDLSVLDIQAVGLLQEIVSPWDKSHTVLLITGTTEDSVAWAGGLLSNSTARQKLKGDIALVDTAGTLTTLNSQVPETFPVNESAQTKKTGTDLSEKILWIALIAIVAILAIGLLVTLIRRRTAAH